jgi:hypothetical protein
LTLFEKRTHRSSLSSQPQATTTNTNPSSNRHISHISKAAIAGASVGAVAGALFFVIFLFFITKRWRKRQYLEDIPLQGSRRRVTPYLPPAVTSAGTQLNRQSQKMLASPDGGQVGNYDSGPDVKEGSSIVLANTSEETSESRRSVDEGLTGLVMEQLEEEDFHTEDQGTRERLVGRVIHLVSARLGVQFEEVPPSYASQS